MSGHEDNKDRDGEQHTRCAGCGVRIEMPALVARLKTELAAAGAENKRLHDEIDGAVEKLNAALNRDDGMVARAMLVDQNRRAREAEEKLVAAEREITALRTPVMMGHCGECGASAAIEHFDNMHTTTCSHSKLQAKLADAERQRDEFVDRYVEEANDYTALLDCYECAMTVVDAARTHVKIGRGDAQTSWKNLCGAVAAFDSTDCGDANSCASDAANSEHMKNGGE